jgi:hypothetical protein
MVEMSEKEATNDSTFDELYDLEPESGVYFGASGPEARRILLEKYPLSLSKLLELKVEAIRDLLREVEEAEASLAEDHSPRHSYQLQRKVQTLRKALLEFDADLLDFSQQLLERREEEHPLAERVYA